MADKPQTSAHGEEPHEQPSEWGWHMQFGRGARIAGWISAVILVLMMTTTHYNWSGGFWLGLVAAILVILLIWDHQRRKFSWRK